MSLHRFEIEGVAFVIIDAPPIRAPAGLALTASEQALLELLARGLTTAELAAARGTSTKTVSNQLGQLYRKLGVNSRTELIAELAGALDDPDPAPTDASTGARPDQPP